MVRTVILLVIKHQAWPDRVAYVSSNISLLGCLALHLFVTKYCHMKLLLAFQACIP
jgi:hypothetical protein